MTTRRTERLSRPAEGDWAHPGGWVRTRPDGHNVSHTVKTLVAERPTGTQRRCVSGRTGPAAAAGRPSPATAPSTRTIPTIATGPSASPSTTAATTAAVTGSTRLAVTAVLGATTRRPE